MKNYNKGQWWVQTPPTEMPLSNFQILDPVVQPQPSVNEALYHSQHHACHMAASIYQALQQPDTWAARHDCQLQVFPCWLFDKFLEALLMLSPLGKSVGHSLIVDMEVSTVFGLTFTFAGLVLSIICCN